jgi:hypothetical protein
MYYCTQHKFANIFAVPCLNTGWKEGGKTVHDHDEDDTKGLSSVVWYVQEVSAHNAMLLLEVPADLAC